MRCLQTLFGCTIVLLISSVTAMADRPVRTATSPNGRFALELDPGRPGRLSRACRATLSERVEGSRRGRRIWRTNFVNDVAPMHVVIRNDGRFIVTLDEFERGGARHALVVYGAQGQLLRHFLLQDLLTKDDWKHVNAGKRSLEWLEDPELTFDEERDHFVVKLDDKRSLRIDLKTLQVIRGKPDDTPEAYGAVPPELLLMLLGHLDEPGEKVIAQRLKELAESTPEQQAETDAVAVAIAGESQQGGLDELALADPNEATPDEMPAPRAEWETADPNAVVDPNAVMATAEDPNATLTEATVEPNEASPLHDPQMTAGLAIPAPDPAHKTDYVAWLNELGRVEGPDAGPLYEAAADMYVPPAPWQDRDVLSYALAGDPNALYSEQFEQWMTANEDALDAFRDAAQLPARGWHFELPENGAMAGILLPQLSTLRSLAKGCIAEGHMARHEGDGVSAAEAYLDAAAAGVHIGHGGTLIENLMGMAIQSVAARAVLDLHADPEADVDYGALAVEAEMALAPLRPAIEAVQLERAFYLDSVQRLWDEDPATGARSLNTDIARQFAEMVHHPGEPQTDALIASLTETGYEDSVAYGNAYFDAVTEALAQPYSVAAARLQELERLMEDDQSGHAALRHLTPALSNYHFSATRAESSRRATLLVNRVRAWQQQHGEPPPSLDVFADREFAIDPFSGTHFVYRRVGDDFVLYSTGGNVADDGGVHDRRGRDHDLVYWPRPQGDQ